MELAERKGEAGNEQGSIQTPWCSELFPQRHFSCVLLARGAGTAFFWGINIKWSGELKYTGHVWLQQREGGAGRTELWCADLALRGEADKGCAGTRLTGLYRCLEADYWAAARKE